MTSLDELRQRVTAGVEALPEPGLEELATFLDYLEYKLGSQSRQQPPFKPTPLGGLWSGITIRDEDIKDVRREMWTGFAEHEP